MSKNETEKKQNKITSPEQLNKYIRVSNPATWIVLCIIIIFLLGICVWGVTGRLETTKSAALAVSSGKAVVYIPADDIGSVKAGMTVRAGDQSGQITSVSEKPLEVSSDVDEYVKYVGNLSDGEAVYMADVNMKLDDGVYSSKIVTESIAPISFLMN